MGKSDSASTKDLRLALRRYRSSFDGCYRFKLADSGTIRCSWNLNYPSSRLSCGDVRQRTEIVMAKAVMEKRADKKAKKAKSVSEMEYDVPAYKMPLEPLDRACPDHQFDLPEALFQICSVSIPPLPV